MGKWERCVAWGFLFGLPSSILSFISALYFLYLLHKPRRQARIQNSNDARNESTQRKLIYICTPFSRSKLRVKTQLSFHLRTSSSPQLYNAHYINSTHRYKNSHNNLLPRLHHKRHSYEHLLQTLRRAATSTTTSPNLLSTNATTFSDLTTATTTINPWDAHHSHEICQRCRWNETRVVSLCNSKRKHALGFIRRQKESAGISLRIHI